MSLKNCLIICTYMRPKPLLTLLESVEKQTVYPNEILIVDGSTNDETEKALQNRPFEGLQYYRVDAKDRGLTRQRNYGIERVGKTVDVVCFLDDDTVLEPEYFENLLNTYREYPEALGVGGYITNEVVWRKLKEDEQATSNEFQYDGYARTEASRHKLRKKLGLGSDVPPGFTPSFSHGRTINYLPPSGKIYPAESFMGGVSSFRRMIFDKISFSTYFEGYGLYEDTDFTLRLSKMGPLYINTSARLGHYHNDAGRPNKFKFGKMAVRNGWYVWRVKNENPSFSTKLKWYAISILYIATRLMGTIRSTKKQEGITESLGRISGLASLVVNKPKIQR